MCYLSCAHFLLVSLFTIFSPELNPSHHSTSTVFLFSDVSEVLQRREGVKREGKSSRKWKGMHRRDAGTLDN